MKDGKIYLYTSVVPLQEEGDILMQICIDRGYLDAEINVNKDVVKKCRHSLFQRENGTTSTKLTTDALFADMVNK